MTKAIASFFTERYLLSVGYVHFTMPYHGDMSKAGFAGSKEGRAAGVAERLPPPWL